MYWLTLLKGSWSISASGMAASRGLNNIIVAGLCPSVPSFLWCCLYSKIDICVMVHYQFSHSVMSNSSQLHGLQHARPPCRGCHHQIPEFAQTHVHQVGNDIQPSLPLLSPSPPAFNLSLHQGLISNGASSSHQVAKVLEFQLQHQSFQWIFRTDFL